MSTFLRCHRDHPYRPVNWRWERARFLRDANLPKVSRRHDDKYVIKARKFLEALDACKAEVDQYALLDKQPDLYYAYELWDEPEGADLYHDRNPGRYELEARLLAGETRESVAAKLGVRVKVVEWYELLFFNVSDRIKNTSYVLNQVMGPAVHRGLTDRQYDVLWKLLGYFCGPVALDAFVTSFVNPDRPDTPEKVEDFCRDWTRSTLSMKAAIAARTMAVNSYTQGQILELFARHREIEADTDPGQARNALLANISAMMESIPWSVGSKPRRGAKALAYYESQDAAEPRAGEVLEAGSGADVPDLSEYKYPEEERRSVQ